MKKELYHLTIANLDPAAPELGTKGKVVSGPAFITAHQCGRMGNCPNRDAGTGKCIVVRGTAWLWPTWLRFQRTAGIAQPHSLHGYYRGRFGLG